MATQGDLDRFTTAATAAGAVVATMNSAEEIAAYISKNCNGGIVIAPGANVDRLKLAKTLTTFCTNVSDTLSRETAEQASGGVTGVNFAIAKTGTLVIESTPEAIRLASTLPEKHFAILDPRKIFTDDCAAVEPLRQFHQQQARNYLAWITGPSRTADIERVLTIGVHGPRELHILLVENLSNDPLEG